jgi:nucleotide-binding universal stress UspA family protein
MKVLIAIDDSPYSTEVINEVVRRRWPLDCEFKILRVIEPITWSEISKTKWAEVAENAHIRRYEDAQRHCVQARVQMEHHVPDCTVHFEIRDGNARAEILDAAAEWNADKIIVGAHGHYVCPRFILGSVSRAVAAHAPCSVEIIRCKNKLHGSSTQPARQQRTTAAK